MKQRPSENQVYNHSLNGCLSSYFWSYLSLGVTETGLPTLWSLHEYGFILEINDSIYKWLMQVFIRGDIFKGVSFISSSRNHTGLEIEKHSCCIRHCFKSYVTLRYQGWISPAKSLYKFFNGFLCHTREYPQMSDRDSNPITFLLRKSFSRGLDSFYQSRSSLLYG